MSRRTVIRVATIAVAIGFLVVAFRAWQDYSRPLFHNLYIAHEFCPVPMWRFEGPIMDHKGGFAVADYHLNLFVVVVPRSTCKADGKWSPTAHEVWVRMVPAATRQCARVYCAGPSEPATVIERQENRLVMCFPDGSVDAVPLGAGCARALFSVARRRTNESGDLLESLVLVATKVDAESARALIEWRKRIEGSSR